MISHLAARLYEWATGRPCWSHAKPLDVAALQQQLSPHLSIESTNDPRWPHTFKVVHTLTGRPLVGGSGCITCCARAALTLAAPAADWATLRVDNADVWLAAAPADLQQVIADYRLGINCFAGPGGRPCGPDGTAVDDEELMAVTS